MIINLHSTLVTNRMKFGLLVSCISIALILAGSKVATAQISGLTTEQQMLLNQLPPEQRQALLARFSASVPAESPGRNAEETDSDSEVDGEGDPLESMDFLQANTIEAGDIIVLVANVEDVAALPPALSEQLATVLSGNPYDVDEAGQINIENLKPITIAGLSDEQTEVRLSAVQALQPLNLSVNVLRVSKFGREALKPYGYDFFDSRVERRQSESLALPTDYTIGPGDTFRISLYGNKSLQYELPVDREGAIVIPELGPVTVAGLSFDSARSEIKARVDEQMIGTSVSITLGELRSVQVTLAGDVRAPGVYNVSALSTILDVLSKGGGIEERGSLRAVQLRRNGASVATLDLYQLLLFGNNSKNRRIRDGDVVFVPPVGPRVSVTGAVNRPAIYEIRRKLNTEGALTLAGGPTEQAFLSGVTIERPDPSTGMSVLAANLLSPTGKAIDLLGGDTVVIPGEAELVDKAVIVQGHVQRPGSFAWSELTTLSKLLSSRRDLLPGADTNYVLVRREDSQTGRVSVFSVDLTSVWRGEQSSAKLHPGDRVYVFEAGASRDLYMKPLLAELRRQAKSADPSPIVTVGGQVKVPGNYPLELGMTVRDLLRAGGGLTESAYSESAELSRLVSVSGAIRQSELFEVSLDGSLGDDQDLNLTLQEFDFLNVKEITRWNDTDIVRVQGEVRFPGEYPVSKGETLSSVIKRAGGLTSLAFSEGSVFTRDTLKQREREQLDTLAKRVESDLASLALSDPGQSEALGTGRALLDQLKNAEPAGRLVINLPAVVSGAAPDQDILLRDGDSLFVPQVSQEVTVIGEVQYATSHLWQSAFSRDEYLSRSGGLTEKADKKRIYVVRANGEVVVGSRSRFFSKSRAFDMRPGDTIVVPLNTDRVKPLVLWSSATQILYNLAIAAAAVNSF